MWKTLTKTPDFVFNTESDITSDIIRLGSKEFQKYIENLGYEDFHVTILKNPRVTKNGILYAEGSFSGPSPYDPPESRDPFDFTVYNFLILEDLHSAGTFIVEVYFRESRIAVYLLFDPKKPNKKVVPKFENLTTV